jgi:predicted RNase H-like HicB family nuclease
LGPPGKLVKGLHYQPSGFIICEMTEIIFEVREDEVEGGFSASALGVGIHSEGDTVEELRANVREAVDCYFDETMDAPRIIRLHFVRDEVLAR